MAAIMKHAVTFRTLSLFALLGALLLCSKEYNPFSDYSNAALYVTHASFKANDTIGVFCGETLSVELLVKELVDSCEVRTTGNRLWARADTALFPGDFAQGPINLYISFYDTGRHVITTTTYRTNGAIRLDSLPCYVTSALRQDSIACFYGDSIVLRTPPVPDKDVNYFWSFDAATRYSSQRCSTKVAFGAVMLSGKGALWVCDGQFSSPADSFSFVARDTAKPQIVCVNENYVGKDTIYTGDSVFNFKVRITTIADQWVDSASINGLSFDGKNDKVYSKLFDKMRLHDAKAPLLLSVFALDHFYQGTANQKLFTVIFSDTIRPASPATIVVLAPSRDSTVTMVSAYQVSGTVQNNAFDSLNLTLYAYVNNIRLAPAKTIKGPSAAWTWPVQLVPGANAVAIAAIDNVSLNRVDSVSFSIIFNDTAHDVRPPTILAITANGLPAGNFYAASAAVLLGVEAFDDGSGMDSLFIGGKPIMPANSSLWYYDSIPLQHTPTGNQIIIRATDKKHNDTVASVILFQNRLPIAQKTPTSSFIAVDSLYSDTIEAFDPDGDSLVYNKSQGPQLLQISSRGVVSWTPSNLDTGSHSITLRIWDGYQPVFYTYTLYVFGTTGHPSPVRFATKTEDFPPFLVAGKDTLRMRLRAAPNTGIPPFVFSTRIVNKSKVLLTEGLDSNLVWGPSIADTGFEQLMVVVKDAFPTSDTLYPRILVLPAIRPCSLTVAFSGDTTATGAIDLNKKKDKDTLIFRIIDPNNQLVERHDVSIVETRTQMHSIIDSAVVDSFIVVVDPLAFNGYDTMVAIVKDESMHIDTLRQAVYYGMPPYSPQALNPINYSVVSAPSITLSWQDADPDNDSLSYDVYLGTDPNALTRQTTLTGTSFLVSGLSAQTTYYWKIISKDWKSSSDGPIWQFTTR
jgi:hypothetical protein